MIKNIIFDFGGILIDIDYQQTNVHIGKHFGINDLSKEPFWSIMVRHEVGHTDTDEFVAELQSQSKEHIPKEILIEGWNSMLGKVAKHKIEMLEQLKSNYNLYLLSNTNVTHIDFVYAYLKEEYGIEDFGKQYFTKDYFSHLVYMRKPNLDIYEYVIKDAEIDPSESIFIDDNADNVAGAIAAGLYSVVHDPKVDITEVIEGYIASVQGA